MYVKTFLVQAYTNLENRKKSNHRGGWFDWPKAHFEKVLCPKY